MNYAIEILKEKVADLEFSQKQPITNNNYYFNWQKEISELQEAILTLQIAQQTK